MTDPHDEWREGESVNCPNCPDSGLYGVHLVDDGDALMLSCRRCNYYQKAEIDSLTDAGPWL